MTRVRSQARRVQPFGYNDSEKERQVLPALYLHELAFNDHALDPLVSIIIGRRGSGKTALAQYLRFETDSPYDVYVEIDEPGLFGNILEQIAKDVHKNAVLNVVEDISRMWELAFWTSLMSAVVEIPEFTNKYNAAPVKRYLGGLSTSRSRGSQVVRAVFQGLATLASHRAGALVELAFKVREILDSIEFEEAKRSLIGYLDTGHTAVIVIDTLEQYEVRHPEMQQALAAMLQAVTDFSLGGAHPNLQIKCFLPAEIVPHLMDSAIQNVGKTFEAPLYLHWRPKDLLRLMCWRYHHYLSRTHRAVARSLGEIDWDSYDDVRAKVWNKFFPERIKNALGVMEDSFQYIIRHTQLRPRQVIWFGNAIAQRSYDRGAFPYFGDEDLVNGIYDIEDSVATEVLNSYRTVYPNARQILACFHGEQNVFDQAAHLDKLAPRTRAAWPTSFPYDRNVLWQMVGEIGFLGAVVNVTERYREAQFEYVMQDRLVFSNHESCAVHPMFYKLFRIQPRRDLIVYPKGPDGRDGIV